MFTDDCHTAKQSEAKRQFFAQASFLKLQISAMCVWPTVHAGPCQVDLLCKSECWSVAACLCFGFSIVLSG